MKLSSNRSIVNCGLTSAHDTCTLSLSSSTEEIKRYFKAILELSKLDIPYPVNLDYVWMLAYSEKGKATRALKENFIESIDYQVLAQNGKNPKGGRPSIEYHLSVSCLEYFIARKVRPVFDVYREVFHKVNEIVPKIAKSSAADKRKIARLEKEIETLEERLKWTKWSERREIELKCSCFSFLVKTKQYKNWEEYRRTGIIKK
ncbi:hypothetical protein [Bacteroides sp. OM08-17BH]|uniref:hypothetical protein n=1 Tax=Bacteroides sp. OM08-17BH TaxID=2292285 RepID=UPI000E4502EA|nr:hypothetical protein [Bacteroides sp. OM08-17BH]RGM25323.1 hypothetical protein DXC20_15130 [Bacteroides sp. OM08-17BH]